MPVYWRWVWTIVVAALVLGAVNYYLKPKALRAIEGMRVSA